MRKSKKKIKFKRYLAISKRKIKRLNQRKIGLWFKVNLKQHPFILGILFFIFIDTLLIEKMFKKMDIIKVLRFHLFLFLSWLILVFLSNFLKDEYKVKWYLRKRFVFFMLLLLPPLGLVFLWSGTQFKRITKIILTVSFSLYFIITQVYYNKKYESLLKRPAFDNIVEIITSPKRKIFLKKVDKSVLTGLRLRSFPKEQSVKLAISEIALRCSPAVVSIKVKDKDDKEIGQGTGFIISGDGVIATNFHVMESAYQAEVKIGEKVFKEVYLINGVPSLDIAILKVNAENLPFLSIGDSDALVNGQFVIVLSNPAGFERSVSNGIISAIREKGNMKIIQMTAPVSMGSSGGPVLNEYGEAIGITTLASFFMTQNLNFAVPINYLQKIINEK